MKKGFTLVELLAIIILLGILVMLVFPKLVELLQNKQREIDESTKKLIYNGVDEYIDKNDDKYPSDPGNIYCISLDKIIKENLIPIDVNEYKNKSIAVRIGKNKSSYEIVDSCDIVLTLENAKFTDGTTSKTVLYGEEVEIIAIVPENYTESNYSGTTSCESGNEGKIRYRVKHEYSVKNWNIRNTTDSTILYRANGKTNLIKANLTDSPSQVDKARCDSTGADYQNAYYTCPNGGTLGGASCFVSTTYAASCSEWPNPNGCDIVYNGQYVHVPCNTTICGCPNSGTLSGTTCYYSGAYAATYHAAYYYCSSGWSLSGATCYKWTGI